ncbi:MULTISPECIES: FtsX-like permease family protein [unclassified Streptomyces]|uniref:FtsX-like permease family protein n=1 Tax=unclassified Streptomyces TaxID=2593676 RepID=UPI002ED11140|nr:hypothetical protein OH827_09930 [Streptomyces sp. NBC_00891]WSY05322.1 hypothetical protein OG464_09930 [Streptomyces sp. NBC_00890]WSZ06946.1 hypothetical protein OG704_09930 [Streptomyces sp. NBC_00869]WSZ25556.1 hypothetical protein OG498_23635 [Streptomyces sp. NBC_00870]
MLSQLRYRPGRALALVAALLVAVTSFSVLTATARTQRLDVVGKVAANDRGAYDLLVRPAGARSALESRANLVSSTALAGLSGGITSRQWRQVLDIPGVDVAAPVAVVGYTLQTVQLPVDLTEHLKPEGGPQLFRVSTTRTSERGLTEIPTGESYVYVTDRPLHDRKNRSEGDPVGQSAPDGSVVQICGMSDSPNPVDPETNRYARPVATLACGSTNRDNTYNAAGAASPAARPANRGTPAAGTTLVPWSMPFLVQAVDPVQEARLAGLDRAVDKGRYFAPGQKPVTGRQKGSSEPFTKIPVLLAGRTAIEEQLHLEVSELPAADAARVAAGQNTETLGSALPRAAGTPVSRTTFAAQDAHRRLIDSLGSSSTGAAGGATADTQIWQYLSALPVRYTDGGDRLAAGPVPASPIPDTSIHFGAGLLSDTGDMGDTAVRPLTRHPVQEIADVSPPAPQLQVLGEFDPERLAAAATGLGAVPMETYFPAAASGADDASRKALGNRPLLPNGNIAGLLSVPPSMITTLSSLDVLNSSRHFQNTTPAQGVNAKAPISVVRVRLKGALGTDALSRERLRLVAEQIHRRTGLDVDVTMGSSPSPVTVTDPAGRYGRPVLHLAEMWSLKGVATVAVAAIDRKALLLFFLILGVCVLFVAGATSAAVRTRRAELAVLACTGWPARRLFALVLTEVGALGALAGLAGAALAVPAGALAGVPVSPGRALLAVPAALGLAVLAALRPGVQAARSHPGSAVAPAVRGPRRAARLSGITRLALTNLARVPGRALLGTAALAGGVAALVALAGISTAFDGEVAGSLLGDAVSVQVRSSDYAAAAVAAVLGAATVADVLYLNVRERAAEYALLRATGWSDAALHRLVLTEAALMAGAASVLGAGAALGADAAFTGRLPMSLVLIAAGTAAAATVVTVLAAAVPAFLLRRIPAARLLAEE